MKILLLALVLSHNNTLVFRMDKVYNSIQACESDGQIIIQQLKMNPPPDVDKVKLTCVTEQEYKDLIYEYQKQKRKENSIYL